MTETILMLVEDHPGRAKNPEELSEQDLDDIYTSIRTVNERSDRLFRFVEKYRQLTKLPPPEKEDIDISMLFKSICALHRKEMENYGIRFNLDDPPGGLSITADPSQVEQVLINLINNSIYALRGKDDGVIHLSAEDHARHVDILVTDNGPGIEEGMLQDIFLPFYTTREDGMGIGLSLSRQIMNLHGGYISVKSDPDINTSFVLTFPK